RQAGMDAQPADVRNRRECIAQFGELGRGQGQRVAAGQDQLVDRWVFTKVPEGCLPAVRRSGLVGIREMAPETVAAVHRTRAARDEQGATGVLVQYPGSRASGEVADRIPHESVRSHEFGGPRQDLEQERVIRVAGPHARDEAGRYADREARIRPGQQAPGLRFEAEPAQQVERVGDRLAPELLPAFRLRGQGTCGYHGGLDESVAYGSLPHSTAVGSTIRSRAWPATA